MPEHQALGLSGDVENPGPRVMPVAKPRFNKGGRPPLPIGAHGNIRTYRRPGGGWRAQTTYRDLDGVTRYVERHGPTKTKAVNALRLFLLHRRYVDPASADITPDTPLAELAEAYRTEMLGKPRSPRTLEEYWRLLDGYVVPAIGRLRVREFTTARADRFLTLTLEAKGASNTKTVRTLLSGMFKVAARHDAVAANPVRETASVSIPRKQAIALTLEQAKDLRAKLRADQRAVSRDLTDLTDLMLATGIRIGEALAVTWNCLRLWTLPCDCPNQTNERGVACRDPDRHWRGAVEIRGTAIRIKGKGLVIKPSPKSQAGFRTLGIPSWCATVLRARQEQSPAALASDPVFPRVRAERDPGDPANVAPLLRDPSNTTKHLRVAYDAAGYPEVTSHIQGRKTVATAMDDAGLSARQAADQLGHADIGTTQKHYFGRERVVNEGAAVMERIAEPDQPCTDENDDQDASTA